MTTDGEQLEPAGEQVLAPEPTEQIAPIITEEDVERYLSGLDDARASQLEPINRRVKGFIASEKTKLDKERRTQDQQYQQIMAKRSEAQRWESQLQALSKEEQAQVLMQPQAAKQHAEYYEILTTQPAPVGYHKLEDVAAQIWENTKQQLMEHEQFKDVDWAEVEGKFPAEAFSSLILAGSEKRVKRMEEELKKNIAKEVEAVVKAQLAAINTHVSEPERLGPAGGASTGLTFQQYLNMSMEEKAKLSPAEIDRAVANR